MIGNDARGTNNYHANTPLPAHRFIRGDANHDGLVNLADSMLLLGYLFLSEPAQCPLALDFDGNDALDIADAIREIGYLFAEGAAPDKGPFPYCATAPGATLPCTTTECP